MSRTVDNALAALLITSVHHVYGAWAFGTPWRLRMLMVAAPAAAAILMALAILKRPRNVTIAALSFWTLVTVTAAVPVGLVGICEGAFNHVLKVLLYYGGGSPVLYSRLFPFSSHELPRDFFFEATGMLQTIPALLAGWNLAPVVLQRLRRELERPGGEISLEREGC